ncbi:MAG: hypothetical protein HY587_02145 [Candidatus Omnitrophica bacterium]|nr:hypothetical protein [Candidatus Omnitrophota bacterium]
MKRKMIALFAILFLILSSSCLFAASPWMSKETYSEQAAGKVEFGVKNTLLGWTDLISEPQNYKRDGKNVWKGIGKGLVDAIVNTVGGVFHLATFPFPFDFPLPEDGVSLE